MAEAVNSDKKKYNRMESVLQYINKHFITVKEEEAKKANPILKHVIEQIVSAMKVKSKLFDLLFTDILYGGSYFDGLKVGKPEEFDIDLRLVLPKLVEATLEASEIPGFVRIQMKGWPNFVQQKCEYEKYKGLEKFKDDKNFLLVNEVMKWMESIVTQAMNTFSKNGTKYLIPYNGANCEITLKKSGPALTALITYGKIYMDVDLVAVFKLTQDKWPSKPFKSCPDNIAKKDFMVVPKAPRGEIGCKDRYWRMSFQEQEKVIILGLNTCKTALRMIKKLRDTQNHNKISSYFIKTVFLHEIDKQKPDFWNSSLSFIFMHMLKTYKNYLEEYKIPYYWNTRFNLLKDIDKIVIDNFKNFLARVIDSVDKKLEDNPLIIADYLSTLDEQSELKKVNFQISNKKQKPPSVDINCCTTVTEITEVTSILPETNNQIINLLQNLQSTMNILQSDMKFTIKKMSHLEESIHELKNDQLEFKQLLQNSNYNTITTQIDNQTSKNIETLQEQFETLNKSVVMLETITRPEVEQLKRIMRDEPEPLPEQEPEKRSNCIIL